MTSDRVLAAARDLVATEGVEALTMRRLADRLGVAPNTIYSHYPDKGALVDAVLDALLGDIRVPDPAIGDWRDGIVELMEASRATLLAHARLLPHLMSRPMRGRNVSRMTEAMLAALERGGIEGPDAVLAVRALLTLTVGSVVLEAPRRLDPQPAARERAGVAAFGSQADLPRVAALAGPLAARPAASDFATSVRWLLSGIEHAAGRPAGGPARGATPEAR
jgi:AcrR family transcriptional regulator